MKKLLLLALLVSSASFAQTRTIVVAPTSARLTEVLVLNSAATELTPSTLRGRVAVEIVNNGPNTIWCAYSSATAVLTKSRPVAAGGVWALDAGTAVRIFCKAASADQVTTAATAVSETFIN